MLKKLSVAECKNQCNIDQECLLVYHKYSNATGKPTPKCELFKLSIAGFTTCECDA